MPAAFLKKEINFCLSSECSPQVRSDLPLLMSPTKGIRLNFPQQSPDSSKNIENPRLVSFQFRFKWVASQAGRRTKCRAFGDAAPERRARREVEAWPPRLAFVINYLAGPFYDGNN